MQRREWIAAVERLRAGQCAGPFEAAVLLPLVEHFDRAWAELWPLAALAESFLPPLGVRPLPVQHLAEFVLDDLVEVFKDAASEVVLLIPDGASWEGDPNPADIQDEAERFDRYLLVLRLAAIASPDAGPLATAVIRAGDALAEWATELAPIIAPIREVLEAVHFGSPTPVAKRPSALN